VRGRRRRGAHLRCAARNAKCGERGSGDRGRIGLGVVAGWEIITRFVPAGGEEGGQATTEASGAARSRTDGWDESGGSLFLYQPWSVSPHWHSHKFIVFFIN
jgi:hypothetical protein